MVDLLIVLINCAKFVYFYILKGSKYDHSRKQLCIYSLVLMLLNSYLLLKGSIKTFLLASFILLHPEVRLGLREFGIGNDMIHSKHGTLRPPEYDDYSYLNFFCLLTTYISAAQLLLFEKIYFGATFYMRFTTFSQVLLFTFMLCGYKIIASFLKEVDFLSKYKVSNVKEEVTTLELPFTVLRGIAFLAVDIIANILSQFPSILSKQHHQQQLLYPLVQHEPTYWQLWGIYAASMICANSIFLFFELQRELFLFNLFVMYPDFNKYDSRVLRMFQECSTRTHMVTLLFYLITPYILAVQIVVSELTWHGVLMRPTYKQEMIISIFIFSSYFIFLYLLHELVEYTSDMLFDSVFHDDVFMLSYLLRFGANPNKKIGNQENMTLLEHASMYGCEDCAKVLLSYKANFHEGNTFYGGRPPLLLASRYGYASIAKLLLDAGADIHCKDLLRGETSLILASYNGHASVVDLLLSKGANTKDRSGDQDWTPLMFAACNGHTHVMELLLSHDNTCVNEILYDAFHYLPHSNALILASIHNKPETVQMLLSFGADITVGLNNAVDSASLSGNIECVRVLNEWSLAIFVVFMEELQLFQQLDFANIIDLQEFV